MSQELACCIDEINKRDNTFTRVDLCTKIACSY